MACRPAKYGVDGGAGGRTNQIASARYGDCDNAGGGGVFWTCP